jgi:hypothetical protein
MKIKIVYKSGEEEVIVSTSARHTSQIMREVRMNRAAIKHVYHNDVKVGLY